MLMKARDLSLQGGLCLEGGLNCKGPVVTFMMLHGLEAKYDHHGAALLANDLFKCAGKTQTLLSNYSHQQGISVKN